MKAMKESEEDDEEEDNDDFVNELKTIHQRKMMMQQKLEGFHARQSLAFALEKD